MSDIYVQEVQNLLKESSYLNEAAKGKLDGLIKKHLLYARDVIVVKEHVDFVRLHPAYVIQDAILDGKFSVKEAVGAMQHLVQTEGVDHNAVTIMIYERAMAQADILDRELQEEGKEIVKRRPLFGYIISVKDSVLMSGTPSTHGLFCNIDRVPQYDSDLVNVLIRNGAIILCKGNMPQLAFSMETSNNLYGKCSCPSSGYLRTSGGSSGGDACLVSLGAVSAAVGSDVAGSLRIPALFCGTCSMMPSSGRLSMQGHATYYSRTFGSPKPVLEVNVSKFETQKIIKPVMGPIARSVKDLHTMMKVLCEAPQNFDRCMPPTTWNNQPSLHKKVGYLTSLPFCPASPAAVRVLEESVAALSNAGYDMVKMPINFVNLLNDAGKLAIQAYAKNDCFNQTLKNKSVLKEELSPLFNGLMYFLSSPKVLLKMINYFSDTSRKTFGINSRLAADARSQDSIGAEADILFQSVRYHFLDMELDAIMMPGLPVPAIKHGSSNDLMFAAIYCFAWNMLNCCGGVVKTSSVAANETSYIDDDKWNDTVTEAARDSMIGSEGLPMGVGIYGLPFHEEVVLSVMLDLEKELDSFKRKNEEKVEEEGEEKVLVDVLSVETVIETGETVIETGETVIETGDVKNTNDTIDMI